MAKFDIKAFLGTNAGMQGVSSLSLIVAAILVAVVILKGCDAASATPTDVKLKIPGFVAIGVIGVTAFSILILLFANALMLHGMVKSGKEEAFTVIHKNADKNVDKKDNHENQENMHNKEYMKHMFT